MVIEYNQYSIINSTCSNSLRHGPTAGTCSLYGPTSPTMFISSTITFQILTLAFINQFEMLTTHLNKVFLLCNKIMYTCSVSVAQLIVTRDNLCRGRGSNIMCVNLTIRLLEQKRIKIMCT